MLNYIFDGVSSSSLLKADLCSLASKETVAAKAATLYKRDLNRLGNVYI